MSRWLAPGGRCLTCNLPDPYNGDGDGIGSCECPRCDTCGSAPLTCECEREQCEPELEPDADWYAEYEHYLSTEDTQMLPSCTIDADAKGERA